MGKKKAKPSEQIACFLNFVDECERIYQTAYEQVGMEDKRVQDLLHEVEFARWIFLCGSTAVPEEQIPPIQRQETAVPEQRYRT